jgi:hypothetical protein
MGYQWDRLALFWVYLLEILSRILSSCFSVNLQRVLPGLVGNRKAVSPVFVLTLVEHLKFFGGNISGKLSRFFTLFSLKN